MNKFPTIAASSCMILALLSGTLFAGPLDRQNVQPRSNPVTQSMIRVPGVVGQEQASAMMAIQQAGLNVSVLEAKVLPKGMEGAAGIEGKVVDQKPSAGGMAMYGTTVTVYVWRPVQNGTGTGAPPGSGAPSWGSTPSYSSQPGFTNPQTTIPVQQQMMPQGGALGGSQTQGNQPFQVQRYYYPDGSGGNPSTPQGQMPTTQPPPMDAYGNPQGGVPQGGQPMQQMPPSPQ